MDGIAAVDVIKSFKELMSPSDYTEFLKSEDSAKLRAFPEVQELLKGEMPEQFKKKEDEPDDKDDEKPGDKKDDKEPDDDEDDKKEDKEDKGKPWEKEKAIMSDLIKGLEDDLNTKTLETNDRIEKLQKSLDDTLQLVAKIAGMPLGTKAVKTGNANFFEKSFGATQKDEEGKTPLSVSLQKEAVLKALENGMSKCVEADLIKAYEDSIIRYNAGGGTISQVTAVDLFENHGIRLTQ
jgi:hypothetical protein